MGLSESEAADIIDQNKPQCRWYTAKKNIVREEMSATALLILINGRLKKETNSPNKQFKLTEIVESPSVIQIERMFGLHTRYTATFNSYGGCMMLEIPKSSVYKLLAKHNVFRINFINMLSSSAQRMDNGIAISPNATTIERRICQFVQQISTFPSGNKDVAITMNVLASELSTSRLNISKALHRLEAKNLIKVNRGHLIVPSLELLMMMGK